MSYSRGSSSGNGAVPASRSVALDLMLRTFMNSSSEFHSSLPRVWDNISKLVPGTTPQQCCERWEELRCLAGAPVTGDCSELTAHGRPLSQRNSYTHTHHQMTKFVRNSLSSPSSHLTASSPPADSAPLSRPHSQSEGMFSRWTEERERRCGQRREREGRKKAGNGGGKFVANFYQNLMSKEEGEKREGRERREGGERRECGERKKERVETVVFEKQSGLEEGRRSGSDSRDMMRERKEDAMKEREQHRKEKSDRTTQHKSSTATTSQGPTHQCKDPKTACHDSNMIIHVFDEQRKSKREFHCPQGVLVKEMQYFSEYLSLDAQFSDEVDISVHCDIPVFEWLMRYAKRGLLEGPQGEILDRPLEPPSLEPEMVVSILISSDFLKMSSLVEQCLDYCHDNISAILSSSTNMACIPERLRERLAAKFTALEVEGTTDKRDKIKSKLFIHQIQELFSPTHSQAECPASAATLHRCKHCNKLLTTELCTLLPCTANRLEVHRSGRLVYSHERDEKWSVTSYLSSLQTHHNLTPRDIYWRLWGIINWLCCSECGQPFQCCDMASCYYHPQSALAGHASTGPPVHICCGSLPVDTSPFPPPQSGCCVRDHTVVNSPNSPSPSLLLSHRDIICSELPTCGVGDRTSGAKSVMKGLSKSSPTINSIQLNFLKNTDLLASIRRHCPAPSLSEPSHIKSRSSSGESATVKLREGCMVAREQQSENNEAATEMSLLTRQQVLSELSELEEDEEKITERSRPPPLPPGHAAPLRHTYKRERSLTHRNTVRRRHSSAPPMAVEWVWDSSKPQRWNQDRQRESDERRISLLCDTMSSTTSSVSTSTPHTLTSSTPHTSTRLTSRENNVNTMTYAGGIFSLLEAQFRAQQTASALAHHPPPHGSGPRLRKR